MIERVSATPIDDDLIQLWATTTEDKTGEVDRGWAEGPYSEQEISDILGDDLWVAARRFGIHQKDKFRQIDDFSEYFVNACTTVENKIPVSGVDAIVNTAKFWSDKILEALASPSRTFAFHLSDGSIHHRALHEDFSREDTKLVGKCIALEAAYKQCAVSPAHARFSIFALRCPSDGLVKFFFARSLPFGAVAAVHGFNRAAMALNYLVHGFVGVPCTHYFDDFTIVVPQILGAEVDILTKKFFDILGWDIKESKDKPMADTFTALGVEVCLGDALGDDPQIRVENKKDRVAEICERISEHLEHDAMTPAEAAELRGKLVLSNSQTYGRFGALAYHHLGKKAGKMASGSYLDDDLRWALQWWTRHIKKAKPRIVRTGKQKKPVYTFTDGSCEPSQTSKTGVEAGYGAVLFDPEDQTLEMFGGQVSEDLLHLLTNAGSKQQVVGQSELIPCHAAKVVWRNRLKHRRVILFIDNEAARYGLIKGSSPTRDSAWLLNEFWRKEAAAESNTWIERVPSASNCADHPSRGKFSILKNLRINAMGVHLPKDYEAKLVKQWTETSGLPGPRPHFSE